VKATEVGETSLVARTRLLDAAPDRDGNASALLKEGERLFLRVSHEGDGTHQLACAVVVSKSLRNAMPQSSCSLTQASL
jgi:hypothetical protein